MKDNPPNLNDNDKKKKVDHTNEKSSVTRRDQFNAETRIELSFEDTDMSVCEHSIRQNHLNCTHSFESSKTICFKSLGQFDSNVRRKSNLLGQERKGKGRRTSYGSLHSSAPTDSIVSDGSVAEIIGSFGWFQFLVLLFSGLREGAVGYDAVITSIILQPETHFVCADNLSPNFNISNLPKPTPGEEFNETTQCFQSDGAGTFLLDNRGHPIACNTWLFPHAPYGASLVTEWSLVCGEHWLVAFIESAFFFGLVTGNLVWGFYADQAGRRKAYLIAHTIALVFGWLAVVAPSMELFTICRFFSAFGSVGYNIIYSIQVELIGTKHRAFSTTLNHFGWGLGVICVPLVDHLFNNYRYIIAVAPTVTLLMYPWAFWLPESSRWLMANGDFLRARNELLRAAKFNGRPPSPEIEKKIATMRQKICDDKMRQLETNNVDAVTNGKITSLSSPAGANNEKKKRPVMMLFTNKILLRDTLMLAYLSLIGHLFYYMLTINFSYMKNLSVEANFITSGAGEWVSVLVGAVLLKFCSRKTCMSIFLLLMGSSFLVQYMIDYELMPSLDTPLIVTLNNGIGTLSGLLLIFVTLIVNQEVYPTVIRQTGSSLVNTIGESGSTLAPVLVQIARSVGPWKADLVFSSCCFVGVVGAQFLTRTDDIELVDT